MFVDLFEHLLVLIFIMSAVGTSPPPLLLLPPLAADDAKLGEPPSVCFNALLVFV